MVWPAIIAAAGGLADSILDNKATDSANDQSRLNTLYQLQKQEEFAKMGIRWKVEDAKAAGLHPLYALGGAGASFSPVPFQVMSDPPSGIGKALASFGQDVSRAAAAGTTETEQLQQELLRAQIRKTNAEAANSEVGAAQVIATPYHSQPRPIGLPGDIQPWQVRELGASVSSPTKAQSPTVPKPWEPTMADPNNESRTAGRAPFWSEFTLHGNGPSRVGIMLPQSTNVSEALEAISENNILGSAIIAYNTRHFGPGWLDAVARGHWTMPRPVPPPTPGRFNQIPEGLRGKSRSTRAIWFSDKKGRKWDTYEHE